MCALGFFPLYADICCTRDKGFTECPLSAFVCFYNLWATFANFQTLPIILIVSLLQNYVRSLSPAFTLKPCFILGRYRHKICVSRWTIVNELRRELPQSFQVNTDTVSYTLNGYSRHILYNLPFRNYRKIRIYRSFATRVSQLKIWHFWVIGIERNVCRCTFNRYSVITQFAKLAAGEQLCRRCTHKKL